MGCAGSKSESAAWRELRGDELEQSLTVLPDLALGDALRDLPGVGDRTLTLPEGCGDALYHRIVKHLYTMYQRNVYR